MNNLDNYRSVNEYREILRILQNSTEMTKSFIWQSHATGKVIIPIQRIEIDFISREVFIQISAVHKDKLFTQDVLFVKLEYKDSVFKVQNFRVDKNKLFFSFPDLIKTIEYRRKPRHSFRPEEGKYIVMKAGNDSQRDFSSEIKTVVCDISESGAGLIVSEQNRNFFRNNRVLWLTAVQDTKLNHPQLCEVVYINNELDPNYVNRKMKQIKIGLRFLSPLSKQFLEQNIL